MVPARSSLPGQNLSVGASPEGEDQYREARAPQSTVYVVTVESKKTLVCEAFRLILIFSHRQRVLSPLYADEESEVLKVSRHTCAPCQVRAAILLLFLFQK